MFRLLLLLFSSHSDIRMSGDEDGKKMLVQGQWSDKRNVYFLVILKERRFYRLLGEEKKTKDGC